MCVCVCVWQSDLVCPYRFFLVFFNKSSCVTALRGRWGWEVRESVWLYSSTGLETAVGGYVVVVEGVDEGGDSVTHHFHLIFNHTKTCFLSFYPFLPFCLPPIPSFMSFGLPDILYFLKPVDRLDLFLGIPLLLLCRLSGLQCPDSGSHCSHLSW